MASLTRWTWVWVNSGSWWWTGRPGVLRFMGSQGIRHDWATELNWTEWKNIYWTSELLVLSTLSHKWAFFSFTLRGVWFGIFVHSSFTCGERVQCSFFEHFSAETLTEKKISLLPTFSKKQVTLKNSFEL